MIQVTALEPSLPWETCLHPCFTGMAETPGRSETEVDTQVPALAHTFASPCPWYDQNHSNPFSKTAIAFKIIQSSSSRPKLQITLWRRNISLMFFACVQDFWTSNIGWPQGSILASARDAQHSPHLGVLLSLGPKHYLVPLYCLPLQRRKKSFLKTTSQKTSPKT